MTIKQKKGEIIKGSRIATDIAATLNKDIASGRIKIYRECNKEIDTWGELYTVTNVPTGKLKRGLYPEYRNIMKSGWVIA